MTELTTPPWPWYLAGTLIGLVVPVLLVIGGRQFGVSANLRHLCALAGSRLPYFQHDWKRDGAWNLVFALGLVLGGWVASTALAPAQPGLNISSAMTSDLRSLGIDDLSGAAPPQLVSWAALATLPGFLTLVGGGLLVGFGARWAGGCTSGHAISGLSALQWPSLVATVSFFVGGLLMAHLVLPWILRG
jgi:uncharacterized protein